MKRLSLIFQCVAILWLSSGWCFAGFIINPYRFAVAGPPPTFVAIGASNNTTYAVPTGTTTGDFMVACVGCDTNSFSTPSGWTAAIAPTAWSSPTYYTACYTRAASGSEPANYTFVTGTYRWGFIATYRGASAVDVVGSVTSFAAGNTTPSLNGITSASNAVLLAYIANRADSFSNNTVPSGMTERYDAQSHSYWTVVLGELDSASSGNRQFTLGTAVYGSNGFLISIKP